MDYEKKYKEALRKATKIHRDDNEEIKHYMEVLFPELAESKDEKIRKKLIENFKWFCGDYLNTTKWGKDDMLVKDIITWLEKQESVDENEVAKRVLNEVANSIMRWLDSNCAESNTFLSAMECEDIENAVRNANWQKIYGYMKKKLEKQDNTAKEVTCTQEVEVGNGNIKALVTEEMPVDKIEPKFKLGDKIRIKNPSSFDKDMEVARIEKDYYICNHIGKFSSEVIPFSKESNYELIEHKSANKVELKFNVGDWIVYNFTKKTFLIKSVNSGYCSLEDTKGNIYSPCLLPAEDDMHLWTIQDAKNGDVLIGKIDGDKYIIIFKRIKDVWVETHGHYNGTLNRFCMPSYMFCRDYQGTFTPATKKQRKQLEKAMAKAGYKWDEEKRELKQIEQKLTDKIESKFKVGDWILYSGDHYEGVRHITKINENGYYIERNGLPHGIIPFNHEICMRLWTIQNAKNGDILATSDGRPFIFKGFDKFHPDCPSAYCGFNKENYFVVSFGDGWWTDEKVYPATQEQRDFLFQKMKEAGYVWDAEEKELKLLITNGDDFFESENCEQKSDLSEDKKLTDDCNFQYITGIIERYSKYCWDDEFSYNILNWFKSLKNRIK